MSLLDRRDGIRVKNLDGVHSLFPHIKPLRCDSDVYINQTFDVTSLVKYLEKIKQKDKDSKLTYFHLFSTAIAKLIYNRPLLNRFVMNKSYYDRNEVKLSFVAKTEFTDTAEESLAVIKVDGYDNLNVISQKIAGVVKTIRSDSKRNSTDSTVNIVGKLPKILKTIVWEAVTFLDHHDLLPDSMTDNSIYHSTVLLSNLGSIKCNSI